MSRDASMSYRVVTYVDRFKDGQTWAQPVRRVSCSDEAGAMFEAVRSLMIASTQPGLYWSEWRPSHPVSQPNPPGDSAVPDRAMLHANGQIVLDLVALRCPGRAGGTTLAKARSGTQGEHVPPARPGSREVEAVRPAERGTAADLVDANDLERLGPVDCAPADRQRKSRAPRGAAGRSSGARSPRGT